MAHQLGRYNLFHLEYDPEKILIYFLPNPANGRTYVKPFPFYTSPYEYCLAYGPIDVNTLSAVHELGHTLGLVDFIKNSDIQRYVNPQKCYIQNKPIKSVMSYCDIGSPNNWFGDDDKNLLRIAGYA